MDITQYIFIVGGIIVLGIVFQVVAMSFHNASKKQFESENPDASVMLIKDCQFHPLGFTNTLTCLTVNDEAIPQIAVGFGKRGYYLKPGKNILELQYETQRPGIMHKWVRTTYEPQKIEVDVEPNKQYQISYDKKRGEFLFEELTKL